MKGIPFKTFVNYDRPMFAYLLKPTYYRFSGFSQLVEITKARLY